MSGAGRCAPATDTMPDTDYIHVSYGEPHSIRRRQMLAAHPELRRLTGATPSSALWTLFLVSGNLVIAEAGRNRIFRLAP